MYSINNRQFVFKQSSGKLWNFCYDERLGLCYSILGRRNTWSDPVSLHKNVHRSFFIDIDAEDRFHILFQDKQGNIFYCRIDNENVKTIPVLNSKSVSSYDKHLYLIPYKNTVHFFYILYHNDTIILAHQLLSEEKVNTPKVIDYVMNGKCPYAVTYDKSDNIYVVYQAPDGKFAQLGYKKYTQAQKNWGDFIPITKYSGMNELPRVICDSNNTIHICYQRNSEKQYELIYQQKVVDKNIWSNEHIIFSSSYSFNEASIVYSNDNIVVYWVRDDIIYYSSSGDYGITWTKPARYAFIAGKQLLCVYYKPVNPYETEKIVPSNLPGSFINGLKLAFYQNPAESSNKNLSADDLKNMIVDSLKMLRGNVEELKESDSSIRDKVSNLYSMHQGMNKEFIKYSVKLNSIEEEINQIKQALSRLEKRSYESEIQDLKKEISALKHEVADRKLNHAVEKIDTSEGGE